MGTAIIVPVVRPHGSTPSSYVKMQADILQSLLRKGKMILYKKILDEIVIFGLVLLMKKRKEHTNGSQGKRSVTRTGILESQTMILLSTMSVCIIILDCGGMIMGLIVTTIFWKCHLLLQHSPINTHLEWNIMDCLVAMNA